MSITDEGSEFIERAIAFARERHGVQQYAGRPYEWHLERVAAQLEVFGYIGEGYIASAWLHDTVEDTPTGIEEIYGTFGDGVGAMVWAVTGVGENRKERNQSIYKKLSIFPAACVLKVADRIANHDATIFDPTARAPSFTHVEMYLKEREEFCAAVLPHLPTDMAAVLNHQYLQLESIVS